MRLGEYEHWREHVHTSIMLVLFCSKLDVLMLRVVGCLVGCAFAWASLVSVVCGTAIVRIASSEGTCLMFITQPSSAP